MSKISLSKKNKSRFFVNTQIKDDLVFIPDTKSFTVEGNLVECLKNVADPLCSEAVAAVRVEELRSSHPSPDASRSSAPKAARAIGARRRAERVRRATGFPVSSTRSLLRRFGARSGLPGPAGHPGNHDVIPTR